MDTGNYLTLMIGHTLANMGQFLKRELNTYTEAHRLRALGQAAFHQQHSTLDHIFTLTAGIKEARSGRQKVFACFVDLRKAFDTLSRFHKIRRLSEMHIPDTLIWGVMSLYEVVRGQVHSPRGLSN